MSNFLGVPYPIVKNAKGYFNSGGGSSQIKSDLLILLLTNPGERVMLPEFGTGLRDLLFDPNDVSLHLRAKELIIKAIEAWEPRISVEGIEVSSADEQSLNPSDDKTQIDNVLVIRILFRDPENIQSVQELKLGVPLGGSR